MTSIERKNSLRKNLKLIILAGGKGTRLSEETYLKPKPMVKIGDYPILWHIMKSFSCYGINEFVATLGYKSEVVKNYFLNFKKFSGDLSIDLKTGKTLQNKKNFEDWKIHLLDTGKNTQTGGRIKQAMNFCSGERIMATYGDALANVNITNLIEFHKSHGKLATLTAVRPPSRFGDVNIDEGRVIDFKEKSQTGKGWINGGYFVLEPEIIDYIPSLNTPFEESPLQTLSKEGQLMAYRHKGFWQPMYVIREKELLEKLWLEDNAPWKIW